MQYSNVPITSWWQFQASPPLYRTIISNKPDLQLPNNKITTSKYTFLTFFPFNLLEQFTKLANIYFLAIAVLQTIQSVSVTNGQPIILFPLAIVVSISMVKDFFEDFKRKKSDKQENYNFTNILRNKKFIKSHWECVRVGDIIRINQDEFFPADLVLICTSDLNGLCFIETKNLDGETNLKQKKSLSQYNHLGKMTEKCLYKENFVIEFEKPNSHIYKFNGSIKPRIDSLHNLVAALDNTNFVLRGCSLKNSAFIFGLVVYTGHETKIMLNSVKARPKRSTLENLMNLFLFLIFFLQIGFCSIAAFFNSLWQFEYSEALDYMEIRHNSIENHFWHNFLLRFGNWIIIFTSLVPISLIVSIEMVKFVQGIFISKDPNTVSYQQEDIPTNVQSSNLNEELGQVQYIFSDKTGTLTKNLMEFKNMSIGGYSYGEIRSITDSQMMGKPKVSNVDFRDNLLFEHLSVQNSQQNKITQFLLHMALCHDIATQLKDDQIVYNASSPDELALVNCAKFCGFQYLGINEKNILEVKTPFKIEQYELLNVIEFNSTRKRMSVILKELSSYRIFLLTKGADSIIEKRLKKCDNQLLQETQFHLMQYSTKGLRTLLLAQKQLNIVEYREWNENYQKCCSSIENREEKMMEMQDQIEQNLEIVGATAIEDKLQDQVGETIELLKYAGIKIWVLTGDKIETAINIAISCKLITNSLEQIILDGPDMSLLIKTELTKQQNSNQSNYAIVVSGDALISITKSEDLIDKFMKMCDYCQVVLACRVSPEQKSEVVRIVRNEKPQAVTLAIGDGANDVSMITAAHVGIGIRGVEGQQAARASDFSIGEFKILQHLVLVHGRESYRKNSMLVLFNFYKNMLLVIPQWFFGFYNGFSAQLIYDQWLYQFYNLIYAAAPVIAYAIFDQESTPDELILEAQQYYQIGIQNELFNYQIFCEWSIKAIIQGMLYGLLMTYFMESETNYEGLNFYLVDTGLAIFGLAIFNSNYKVLQFSNQISLGSIILFILSVLSYILTFAITSEFIIYEDIYNSFNTNPIFYASSALLIIMTSVLIHGFEKYLSYQTTKVCLNQLERRRKNSRNESDGEEV